MGWVRGDLRDPDGEEDAQSGEMHRSGTRGRRLPGSARRRIRTTAPRRRATPSAPRPCRPSPRPAATPWGDDHAGGPEGGVSRRRTTPADSASGVCALSHITRNASRRVLFAGGFGGEFASRVASSCRPGAKSGSVPLGVLRPRGHARVRNADRVVPVIQRAASRQDLEDGADSRDHRHTGAPRSSGARGC